MRSNDSEIWLQRLGYDNPALALHRAAGAAHRQHRYGPELDALLDPRGPIRAQAVFDIEGVPTVCFLNDDGLLVDADRLDAIRRQVWNQNLISLILVLGKDKATGVPVTRRSDVGPSVNLSGAYRHSHYSAADVQSGDIYVRHTEWFRHEEKVDSYLLRNLNETVRQLAKVASLTDQQAQELVGQLLFVSYLESRGIVSDIYRNEKQVERMCDLVSRCDRAGMVRLLKQLKADFNGDFLESSPGEKSAWRDLSADGFEVARRFLSGEDMASGQQRFWGYDFSFLPVELISGIYESFLRDEQDKLGAYYTPRNLANLVIDQAFSGRSDLSEERVYDGACGSGILLTTAFRRILSQVEARRQRLLHLAERIELLKKCIFGSDVSKTACQMTAFSLYLSLLERLEPADLALLERGEGTKLPPLRGINLHSGAAGDFFETRNRFASKPGFTIFICNPPWREPKKDEESSADRWAEGKLTSVRRQLAGTFAHRALDCLVPSGRLCLILPVSLFLAPTSQPFVTEWLTKVRLQRLINFGDLRDLLFDRAHHACLVALGSPRSVEDQQIAVGEEFEYWVPKADTSLAMGRLTLRGDDRHRVQTQRVITNNQTLVTLSWGGPFDMELGARMRRWGRLDDMFSRRQKRWRIRKGIHLQDSSREAQSAAKLRTMRFIPVESLQGVLPVLPETSTTRFPKDQETVVGLDEDVMEVFRGPRVVFPDGPSPELEVRAHFISFPASFTSSVGVISGPTEDSDLLRFTAAYLRSDLVRYFVVMGQYSVLVAQDRITLKDLRNLPFLMPERHTRPTEARAIVRKVASIIEKVEAVDPFYQPSIYDEVRPRLQALLCNYFGLTESETKLVQEIVNDVIPSIQPRGFKGLRTQLQYEAPIDNLSEYAEVLQEELVAWRDACGGSGEFNVEVGATGAGQGRFAIVRVDLARTRSGPCSPTVHVADRAVEATIRMLQDEGMLPMKMASNIYLAADVVILLDSSAYIIKPLQRRAWLRRSALQDAQRIVTAARDSASPSATEVE